MFEIIISGLELCFIHLPLILGAYVSISLMKLPDLALETAFSVGATSGALMLLSTPCWKFGIAGFFICCCVALCSGIVNGLLITYLTQIEKLSHLLASILINSIFYSVQLFLLGAHQSFAARQLNFGSIELIQYHPEFFALLVCALITSATVFYLLKRQIGCAVAIYGWNEEFFTHYNISSSFVYMIGICTAHSLAALSGYLFVQTNGFATSTIGNGKAVLCIISVIIGSLFYKKKNFASIMIPLTGIGAYFILQLLFLKIGISSSFFSALQAISIIILLKVAGKKEFFKKNNL